MNEHDEPEIKLEENISINLFKLLGYLGFLSKDMSEFSEIYFKLEQENAFRKESFEDLDKEDRGDIPGEFESYIFYLALVEFSKISEDRADLTRITYTDGQNMNKRGSLRSSVEFFTNQLNRQSLCITVRVHNDESIYVETDYFI